MNPFTHTPIRIGVMGAAGGEFSNHLSGMARALGEAIASQGCCLLTGACPGLPHHAVLGAKSLGGHVIGISPATTLREHVDVFVSPYREYDVMIYTGLGLMGRELINIHSSDIVVIVGGRSGTLGEFAIAYEQGKLIGVLHNSGGIATALPDLEKSLAKNTGAEVLYRDDPKALVRDLLDRYQAPTYRCPARQMTINARRDRRSAPLVPRPRRSDLHACHGSAVVI